MLIIRGLFDIGKCKVCGRRGVILPGNDRTSQDGICSVCEEKLRVADYSKVNDQHRGAKSTRSWSIEFEVSQSPLELGITLLKAKYIPTADGSLSSEGIEWKSPIYHNRGIYLRDLQKIEPYVHREILDSRCGTHIHVGVPNWEDIRSLQPTILETLLPLHDYMRNNMNQTRSVWGRYFNTYATSDGYLDSHYNWVSLSFRTRKTVEWRLAKYRTAKQFYWITLFVIEATKVIADLANILKAGTYKQSSVNEVDKTGKQIMNLYKKAVEVIG